MNPKLISRLRRHADNLDLNQFLRVDCAEAADELERLQAMKRTAQETFDLAVEIGQMNIFGKWTDRGEDHWCRPEPNRALHDSRVQLWREDGDREPGWYYRLGFGVLCISGVNSTKPFGTADEAKQYIDAVLAGTANTVIVEPLGEQCRGGGNELTNLQTVCCPCHRRVTAELAADRAAERRDAKRPLLERD